MSKCERVPKDANGPNSFLILDYSFATFVIELITHVKIATRNVPTDSVRNRRPTQDLVVLMNTLDSIVARVAWVRLDIEFVVIYRQLYNKHRRKNKYC